MAFVAFRSKANCHGAGADQGSFPITLLQLRQQETDSMNQNDIEARLSPGELYHQLSVPHGAWIIVRLQGHALPSLHETRLHEPFDERFRTIMARTAHAVMEELGAVYCFTCGEEISALFPFEWSRHERRVETLNSIASSVASAAFTLSSGELTHFMSRLWVTPKESLVMQFFRWRQLEAVRSSLNMWVFRTLLKKGRTEREAAGEMQPWTDRRKLEFLRENGIVFHRLPAWQKRGVALYYETETGKALRTSPKAEFRRRLREERNLPTGQGYMDFLRRFIQKEATRDIPIRATSGNGASARA
jgi:tRNA(His) 5'-end guanylyltransferase